MNLVRNRSDKQLTATYNPEAVEFIEKLLLGVGTLGILGMLITIYRAVTYGLHPEILVRSSIYLIFLVIVIFRKKLPVNHMVFISIGLSWAFAFMSIYSWGMASQGAAIITISFIVCSVFYGRVGTIILYFFTSIFFIMAVHKFVFGTGSEHLDVAGFSISPAGWGLEVFAVVCLIGYLSFLLERYSQSLRRRMRLLKEKQSELESERKLRDEAARKQDILYKEKSTLVKEVHHRVQNNLHVISSLIQYQAFSIKDEEARNLLTDIKSRILAFSMLHKEINQEDEQHAVNFSRYTSEIARILAHSKQCVKIEINDTDSQILLPLDTALPCSLVSYEVLSMFLKENYLLKKEECRIRLQFNRQDSGDYFFSIEAPGVDLGRLIKGEQDSMGFSMVKQICESLGADYQFSTTEGARFHMAFKEYSEAGAQLF